MNELSDRLRQARLQAGLTVDSVATAIDTSPTSIWRYEAGQRRPSGPTLHALAGLFNKTVEWFYGEDEVDSPEPTADPDYEADLELVMNEASLALRQVSDRLSREAIKSIADYIRFVDEREERERRESEGPG